MRTLSRFVPLVFMLVLVANPPGFIHADPGSGWIPAAPTEAKTPTDGQHAFIMNAPNCFIMADGTRKCENSIFLGADLPIGMRTLALTLLCRNAKPERPLIVILRNPTLAVKITFRDTVRA